MYRKKLLYFSPADNTTTLLFITVSWLINSSTSSMCDRQIADTSICVCVCSGWWGSTPKWALCSERMQHGGGTRWLLPEIRGLLIKCWKDEGERQSERQRGRAIDPRLLISPSQPHTKQAIIPVITSPSLILIVRTPLLLLISNTCSAPPPPLHRSAIFHLRGKVGKHRPKLLLMVIS